MSNMDSVFANCAEDELEFDTVFDIEDGLVDTVNGVNESGEPLTGTDFVEPEQTDSSTDDGAGDSAGTQVTDTPVGGDDDVTNTTDSDDDSLEEGCKGKKKINEDRDIDDELNGDDSDDDRDIDDELNGIGENTSIKDDDDGTTDDDIEAVDKEKLNKKASSKLDYDLGDEELIDLVSSGKA